jgi:threonine aldolase
MAIVDLRSDTVTRPTKAMRQAMADAEVGDDVYGEDPTVKQLEQRVAELLGTEAALFVPTGTMANQIALKAHTRPGDEVIAGKDAHCWRHESGALAALAGAQTQLTAEHRFTAAELRAMFKSADDPYVSPTRVVAVENTHNMGGGLSWDHAALAEVTHAAHALGMITHLDGARLWNAAVAGNTTEKALANGFDSISVCLSKGLGAPAGSVVAGTRDFIRRCHRLRKMHGGGMRQAGILAAGGLYAVDNHRARLSEDHANARAMGELLVDAKNIKVDLASIHTNIVMIDLAVGTADAVTAVAREDGVLLGAAGPHRIRAVTHLDVDRDSVTRAAKVIADIAASLG